MRRAVTCRTRARSPSSALRVCCHRCACADAAAAAARRLWCVTAGSLGCSPKAANRPVVMYTALVHAREPATLMCLVYALRSLLADAAARVGGADQLLASRRLLLMPITNPDGYAWNQRT